MVEEIWRQKKEHLLPPHPVRQPDGGVLHTVVLCRLLPARQPRLVVSVDALRGPVLATSPDIAPESIMYLGHSLCLIHDEVILQI